MKSFIGNIKKSGTAKNSLRSLLAVLLLICGVHNAMALGTCDFVVRPAVLIVDNEITANESVPVGGVLASKNYNLNYRIINSCTGQFIRSTPINTSVYSALNATTFNSGVNGVGFRVYVNNKALSTNSGSKTTQGDGKTPYSVDTVRVDFINTGEITPGTVPQGIFAPIRVQDSTGSHDYFTIQMGTIVVKRRSCDITGSSAIPVPMGTAKREDFTGKNSTLKPVNIKIPLQCLADTTVNISFDATSTQGNGIIDLTKGGAEGVGIQLKMNNTPVEFDKKIFVAKTTQQGPLDIPLTAAYIQTADDIAPGPANAVANFTVTYE
jgi:type 1 fimbria pilin